MATYDELPIFPLPGVVLFPGTQLPLHVFEPRYVKMTRDVMAGDKLMGIVGLLDVPAPAGAPPLIHEVATVGRVVACQELSGDRLAIVVGGLERIHIRQELPASQPYRQVRATVLAKGATSGEADEPATDDLVAMCERIAMSLGEAAVQLSEALRHVDNTSDLTDLLAAAFVSESDMRQQLLEQLDPAKRVRVLHDHVSELMLTLRTQPQDLN